MNESDFEKYLENKNKSETQIFLWIVLFAIFNLLFGIPLYYFTKIRLRSEIFVEYSVSFWIGFICIWGLIVYLYYLIALKTRVRNKKELAAFLLIGSLIGGSFSFCFSQWIEIQSSKIIDLNVKIQLVGKKVDSFQGKVFKIEGNYPQLKMLREKFLLDKKIGDELDLELHQGSLGSFWIKLK